ncbi:MAG: NAD-dependent epimerase/dehydratase family protein [Nocardioidaceae bacterium]
MVSVLIAGATGLVGRHCLVYALQDERIDDVVAPTRRALPSVDGLTNPVLDLTALAADSVWWAVDAVICALGTTRRRAGSAEAFRRVDHDLTLTIAGLARDHGATTCVFTSSVGTRPDVRSLYLRIKGETEAGLERLGFPSLTIVRPAGMVTDGRRSLSRINQAGAEVSRIVAPVLPKRLRPVPVDRVAAALVDAAATGAPGHYVRESETL